MKRFILCLIVFAILSGCAYGGTSIASSASIVPSTDAQNGNESQTDTMETQEWVETNSIEEDIYYATSDGNNNIWLLRTDNTLVKYSSSLEKLQEISPQMQLETIYCNGEELYAVTTNSGNEIYSVQSDGTLELACSVQSDDLEGRTIYEVCQAGTAWLLRLNDTSLLLADGNGKIVDSLINTSVSSICTIDDSAVALDYTFATNEYVLYTASETKFDTGKTIELPQGEDFYKICSTDTGVYIYGNGTLFSQDGSTVSSLCTYSNTGNILMTVPSAQSLTLITDQGIFLLAPPDESSMSNGKQDDGEKVTLTLAVAFDEYAYDEFIKKAAKNFNSSRSDVEVVIKNYFQDGGTESDAVEALNLEIVAGEGPDLLDTVSFSADTYSENGTLISLKGRVQALDLENYHPNFVKALTISDDIYSVMAAYSLACAYTYEEYLPTVGLQWSLTEFENLMDTLPENCYMYLNPEMFLGEWCNYNITDYIDDDQCSFNSDSFIHLLKIANTFPEYTVGSSYYQAVAIDQIHFVDGFRQSCIPKIGSPSADYTDKYIGMPSDISSGIGFAPTISFGISAQSEYPDLCWEFIEYLLSEEFQESISNNTIPVYTIALDKDLEREMSLEADALTQEQADKFKDLISLADHLYGSYSEVKSIVLEESAAYFSGDKTAEDVADVIQNRASIYLAERS